MTSKRQRALALLTQSGFDPGSADSLLSQLERAGLVLADATQGEFICRWIDIAERPVPADADTIVRTVTRTHDERSVSRTHWLEGIEPPPFVE
jgi:hypothetical protein